MFNVQQLYLFYVCRNFKCGRIVCTYNSAVPFFHADSTALYFRVRNTSCVTALYRYVNPDPVLVPPGVPCDVGRVNDLKSFFKTKL